MYGKVIAHVAFSIFVSIVTVVAAVDQEIIDAVKTHDVKAVEALIDQGVDVNIVQADGSTALHWAVEANNLAIVDLLLKAGASVSAENDYGVMPLWLAATNGSAEIINKLLQAGASVNKTLPTGESVLMTAARTGKVDAIELLLRHGANINAVQTSKGQSALMWAISEQHFEAVDTLIRHGADITLRTASGFTPLLFACREDSLDIVRLVLDQGADINKSSDDGSTPILVAIVRGNVDIAQFLLEQGANPDGNLEDAGYTPLMWASTVSEGVITSDYPNAPGEWDALAGIPIRSEKISLIKALVASGADINARVTKDLPRFGFTLFKRNYLPGGTPFYLAAMAADVEVMKLLIELGADTTLNAKDNTTPITAAAGIAHEETESLIPKADRLEAVKYAYEIGNDFDATNDSGFAAIHAAAYAGTDSVVQFLVDQGAKLNETTTIGQSPLGIAEGNFLSGFFFERPDTAELLRKLGAVSHGALSLESLMQEQEKLRLEAQSKEPEK